MIDDILVAYDKLPANASNYKGVILYETETGMVSIYQGGDLRFSIYIDDLEINGEEEDDNPEIPNTGETEPIEPTGETDPIEEQEDTPAISDPTKFDLGNMLYKVGLISDIHLCTDVENDSQCYNDLSNALEFFSKQNVEFIACAGDVVNNSDNDFIQFKDIYNYYAYSNNRKRLFCSMGNEDYCKCFSKRNNSDSYTDETLYAYITLWGNIGKFKSIPDKGGTAAENDITFFEYDGWDYNKNDFKKQTEGFRTTKSKLSYYIKKENDIFVFLSVDFGIWNNANYPGDALSKGFNILNKQNKYVQEMKSYVSDTNYSESLDGNFDYQFYNPDTLMWLKHICDKNKDKRIFVITHYFLPNKVGDGNNVSFSNLRIWPLPTSNEIRNEYYSGSNTLCGLEFYFINKLNNENKNMVWISGHSDYSWSDGATCYYDYDFKQPNGDETTPIVSDLNELKDGIYDYKLYIKTDNNHKDICGLNIHLPSLSKPVNKDGKILYKASEGGILELYENGIVLKEIIFKEQGNTKYTNTLYKTEIFKL